MTLKNVVFMGTPDFAVGTLEALIGAGYCVQAVFTQPDKPKGRKGILTPPPVKETALSNGIPVYQPQKISAQENIQILEKLSPDVIVVAAFGQIIPRKILDLPIGGCINVHASLLPKYRGAAPIQRAIIDGEKETGVTIMRMNEGLDTGDIIMKAVVPISPDETGGSLFDRLSETGARLLLKTLEAVADGTAVYQKQPENSPTPYAAMLTKKDGLICWSCSAQAIERLVRGLSPWPTAYTILNGKQLKLWSSRVPEENTETVSSSLAGTGMIHPGTVLGIEKDAFLVQTGDGVLRILEVQLEGKKRMDVQSFLRGYHLEEGTVLG